MDYNLPKRVENSNKGTYGRVLNIAGSDYMPGAAYLSSISALKAGCGYCFLCSTERAIDAAAAKSSNIVFVPRKKLLEYLSCDIISIGCGLSQDDTAVEIFETTIQNTPAKTPIIIDADGLNILSKNPQILTAQNFEKIILTPHPKEAARLLNCTLEEVLNDIEQAAAKISRIFNCITVLKTHHTVVISPDGHCYHNTTGNNSMAKAGSGDVLTGIIAGLTAQGTDIFEAAALGVYLHGLSGDLAKEKLTEYSVMAEDLISFLPSALKLYMNK